MSERVPWWVWGGGGRRVGAWETLPRSRVGRGGGGLPCRPRRRSHSKVPERAVRDGCVLRVLLRLGGGVWFGLGCGFLTSGAQEGRPAAPVRAVRRAALGRRGARAQAPREGERRRRGRARGRAAPTRCGCVLTVGGVCVCAAAAVELVLWSGGADDDGGDGDGGVALTLISSFRRPARSMHGVVVVSGQTGVHTQVTA